MVPTTESMAVADQRHRTLLLHEFHRVGADELPAEHRTVQTIEATTDGFDRYPYRFDTTAADVEVLQGGVAGPLYAVGGGLSAVDILLAQPLQKGEVASLEYRSIFRYAVAPRPEFRRAARYRVENLLMRVQFDPERLPRSVWWAVWHGLQGPVVEQELVELDREFAVKRYLEAIERTVVGFRWEW